MSVIKSNGAGDQVSSGFYNRVATQSLRFDHGSSAYLSFTPSSTGDRKIWTWSGWIKRTSLSSGEHYIYSSWDGSGNGYNAFYFSGNKLATYFDPNNNYGTISDRLFRDVSSWYHIVHQVDAGNTSQKVWVNGEEQTLSSGRNPANNNYQTNTSGRPMIIGKHAWGTSSYNNMQLAEVNYMDGQKYQASDFGETKNGVWIAKEPSGITYGTNGYRLQFKNTGTGTASSSTIGADTSGNNNHFTSTNIAASDCAMPDSPENNFATLNPLHLTYASTPYSEGNLKVVGTGSAGAATYSTVASNMELTGKVYFEVYINALSDTGRNSVGIVGENYLMNKYGSISTVGISGFDQAGDLAGVGTGDDDWNTAKGGNASTETTIGYTGGGSDTVADVGDIVQIAYDSATGYAWYGVINRDSSDAQAWFNSGNPANGSGYVGILDTAVKQFAGGIVQSSSDSLIFNFGQDGTFAGSVTAQGNTDSNGIGDFYGTVPSGFVASCSANLPKPTIGPSSDTQADDHFKTVIYNGSNNTQTITTGLQPDWIWIKVRSLTGYHNITDTSRGVTRELYTNTADDEENNGRVASSSTTGFTFPDSAYGYTNEGGQTFVSWNWHANGGSTSSNSDGSITSTVQANTTAGFSIATWTASGTDNDTIGHGLGVTPDIWILKSRSASRTWVVYNKLIDGSLDVLFLDTNSAKSDSSANNPTSTVVYVKGSDINTASDTMVGYFFAGVEGFSKFGSFTGNGNADGVYVALNFSPSFVMTKNTARSADWRLHDIARQPTNDSGGHILLPNSSSAEVTNEYDMDFLSNGFKMRTSSVYAQGSGETVIYMAFAEAPFKYANAR